MPDITETKEAVLLGATIAQAIKGANQIPAELKDLDEAELEELRDLVSTLVGDIAGDKAERIAAKSINAVAALADLVDEIRETEQEGAQS